MAYELTTKNIKTGLAIFVGSAIGLYLGYLVGVALIAAGLNPVGAGFLALLITVALMAALAMFLWGTCVRIPEIMSTHKEQVTDSSNFTQYKLNYDKHTPQSKLDEELTITLTPFQEL